MNQCFPGKALIRFPASPMDYENRETERAWLFPTISRSALSMEKGKEKSPSCKSRLSGAPKKIPYKKLLNHSAAGAAGVPSGVFVVGKMVIRCPLPAATLQAGASQTMLTVELHMTKCITELYCAPVRGGKRTRFVGER